MAEDSPGSEPDTEEMKGEDAASKEQQATLESNISASIVAFESAKAAGNSATQAGNFQAALQLYSSALCELQEAVAGLESVQVRSDQAGTSKLKALYAECAAVLCNRAHARIQLRQWREAEKDATDVLKELAAQGGGMEKLRVKALWRRATAREALGNLWSSVSDLNLALKAAPGNEGITNARRRVETSLPPPEEDGDEYLLDNTKLQSKVKGLLYRRSPRMEDLDNGSKAPWNSVVRGILINDDWLKVGTRFLPTNVRGIPSLKPFDGKLVPRRREWKPMHPFNTSHISKLVDAELVHGQVALDASEAPPEIAMRFACGFGISTHPGKDGKSHGCLKFIWMLQERESQDQSQVCENTEHSGEASLMSPCDGTHVEYDVGGNVRRFWQVQHGKTSGAQFFFNRDGSVDEQSTGIFGANGRLESGDPSDREFSTRFIFHALMEVILPLKKALDIALSPGEERLVAEHGVMVDDVIATRLDLAPLQHG